MRKTTLLPMIVLASLLPVAAASAQTPATNAPATNADETTLPVSLDRIRKALTVEPPATPIDKKVDTEDGVPRFAVRTEAPRTLVLRSYLDDGTAVPAYVRAPFDPYHHEFLEMVTPDAAKGCAQFDERACITSVATRAVSAGIWQRLAEQTLRGMFNPSPVP